MGSSSGDGKCWSICKFDNVDSNRSCTYWDLWKRKVLLLQQWWKSRRAQAYRSARLRSIVVCSLSISVGVMKRLSKNCDWVAWAAALLADAWAANCNGFDVMVISRPFIELVLATPSWACWADAAAETAELAVPMTDVLDEEATGCAWRRGNRSNCWRAAYKECRQIY